MGLILLGLCVAAVLVNEGTSQTAAIVVAALNDLMAGQMGEASRGESAGGITLLTCSPLSRAPAY